MAELEKIQRQHVLQAITEHDQLGGDTFLDAHGFAPPGEHRLLHDGRSYDAKAIVGVAHGHAAGYQLQADELSPGREGAARVLQVLGFEVDGPHLPRLAYANAATVGSEHARATWALAARELLVETAQRYHAVVTYQQLAEFVQRRSLIRTTQQPQHWLGDVLSRISSECERRREPFLSSLCVDSHGRVGAVYRNTIEQYRGENVADPDAHAAEERLDCYRHFGAALPPGGGVPAMPPPATQKKAATIRHTGGVGTASAVGRRSQSTAVRGTATRTRAAAKPAPVEKPLVLCPVHFQVLPASGVCDLCD
ncbi:MAG: hypothetical protein QOK15_3064 [Nocardioidaceae bacterium]|nr:hypothetical protein [Nocardioidaceae bacterium]